MWFQMNRASPPSTAAFTRFVNATLLDCWIGRFSAIIWSPHSPDLSNSLLLWRYLKSKIYNNIQIENTLELRDRIESQSLKKCCACCYYPLSYCLGGHFEQLQCFRLPNRFVWLLLFIIPKSAPRRWGASNQFFFLKIVLF